jgi:hypothetical protein
MLDKQERAKLIVGRILALDERFGQVAPPRTVKSTSKTRMISDQPSLWNARWSKEYETGPDGNAWDLLELFIYGQARMTAIARGEEVVARYYIPGKWEPIFLIFDPNDTVPLLPN